MMRMIFLKINEKISNGFVKKKSDFVPDVVDVRSYLKLVEELIGTEAILTDEDIIAELTERFSDKDDDDENRPFDQTRKICLEHWRSFKAPFYSVKLVRCAILSCLYRFMFIKRRFHTANNPRKLIFSAKRD